jgi:hypothetical protein
MWLAIRFLPLAVVAAASAFGCGGSATVGSLSNGGEGGAGDFAPEQGVAAPAGSSELPSVSTTGPAVGSPAPAPSRIASPGTVLCGAGACNSTTQVCCAAGFSPGAPTQDSCAPIGDCLTGGSLSCSSAASCPEPEVCCFSASTTSADPLQGGSARCQSSCSPDQTQICATSAECPQGQACMETGGELSAVCQYAVTNPAVRACTLQGIGPAGGGMGGLDECITTVSATCGGQSYQATCACPNGTCACFGPSSGHVVTFPGCPSFCPGAGGGPNGAGIGPTSPAYVLALCGFP